MPGRAPHGGPPVCRCVGLKRGCGSSCPAWGTGLRCPLCRHCPLHPRLERTLWPDAGESRGETASAQQQREKPALRAWWANCGHQEGRRSPPAESLHCPPPTKLHVVPAGKQEGTWPSSVSLEPAGRVTSEPRGSLLITSTDNYHPSITFPF